MPGAGSGARDPIRITPLLHPARERYLRPVLFLLYLAAVLVVAAHHEMWRDEVRALSVAIHGDSWRAMIHDVRGEGHPLVWYALLRLGYGLLFHSTLVLPIASALIAVAAVVIVLWRSRLPLAVQALFVLGVLPVFEYSVMARNYGIGMLAIFLVAWHDRRRFAHPIRHGLLLLLLANTSLHAAIIAMGFLLAWIVRAVEREVDDRHAHRVATHGVAAAAGMVIALAGLALCAWTVLPARDATFVTVPHAGLGQGLRALAAALTHPGAPFQDLLLGGLLPHTLPPLARERWFAVLAALFLGLALWRFLRHRDLAVALVTAVIGLHVFFRLVYPPGLRHVGLLLVMLLGLEWIARGRERIARGGAGRRAFEIALVMVLLVHVVAGAMRLSEDYGAPLSSNRGLAAYLRSHPAYRRAVIVSEPDYLVESLPYYAPDQPLFSARQERPFRWVQFSRAPARLTLGRLLDVTDSLARAVPDPVLLVLGHRATLFDPQGEIDFSYGLSFTWNDAERERLLRDHPRVATFSAHGDEDYAVFEAARGAITGARPTSAAPPRPRPRHPRRRTPSSR